MGFNKNKCLKFQAITAGDLSLAAKDNIHFYFSKDDGANWIADTISLDVGDEVFVKGTTYPGGNKFQISCKLKHVSGSVMSLVDDGAGEQTAIENDNGFKDLFRSCSNLVSIEEGLLSATTLSKNCYSNMFCEAGLTYLPERLLPALILKYRCYEYMFYKCPLYSIPKGLLPAGTLAEGCYMGMFYGCTNITTLPAGLLHSKTLANSCYYEMFDGCKGITTIPTAFLPAQEAQANCYGMMFSGCTALKKVQKNAIGLKKVTGQACEGMFYRCSKLNEIHVNFDSWYSQSGVQVTNIWVDSVASSGTFYCPSKLPIERGVSRIPNNWTVTYEVSNTGTINIFGFAIPARRKTIY